MVFPPVTVANMCDFSPVIHGVLCGFVSMSNDSPLPSITLLLMAFLLAVHPILMEFPAALFFCDVTGVSLSL